MTYRTHRLSDEVQIWLLEGRDYRSSNTQVPGPNKTMWGEVQKAWLKQTLKDSDATINDPAASRRGMEYPFCSHSRPKGRGMYPC